MNTNELAQLGYDTDDLAPGIDYVPDPVCADETVWIDLVDRAFLQLDQLKPMGGVNVLGGSPERLDRIHLAMEDEVDLMTAVNRLGDKEQKQRARHLIAAGQVSS